MTMKFVGWGIVGKPQAGVIVDGVHIDVTGYHPDDYWDDDIFLGPDKFGIVPVYQTSYGAQFPSGARKYPYFA